MLVAPGAYPRRKHLKGHPIGFPLALPSNSNTQLERVTKGKPSSLLGLVIRDKWKKFYNIDTKSFITLMSTMQNFLMLKIRPRFVLSAKACPCWIEKNGFINVGNSSNNLGDNLRVHNQTSCILWVWFLFSFNLIIYEFWRSKGFYINT